MALLTFAGMPNSYTSESLKGYYSVTPNDCPLKFEVGFSAFYAQHSEYATDTNIEITTTTLGNDDVS